LLQNDPVHGQEKMPPLWQKNIEGWMGIQQACHGMCDEKTGRTDKALALGTINCHQ